MNRIAIIPARSGSKGLPDKNIAPMNGKPLIAYTIAAAVESGCFDTVMVSTDSEHYAQIAKEYGAEVPFLRSDSLSGDCAGSWDVVREVLGAYAERGKNFRELALLQPTSPLRNAEDICKAFAMLDDEVHTVVSVTPVDHPVQWCFTMPQDGSMEAMAKSPYSYMRRQELETHYRENGAIYIVDARKIMDPEYNLYLDACHGYVMPAERSVDIDSRIDLIVAEELCREQEKI